MVTIDSNKITQTVKELCIKANMVLPCDLVKCINLAQQKEQNPLAKGILTNLEENLDAAKELNVPICQDTGMAIVFVELGQDVHIKGMGLNDAINEGVRQGYLEGFLRCSIVKDPIDRVNTNDNTPCIIHLTMVCGEQIHITVAPKGFGSENMSAIKMFTPSASEDDIVDFVCETVKKAGSNPCPPVVVGVGIGGDFEYAAYLAKKALCEDISTVNNDPYYEKLSKQMLTQINKLGIGVQGFGGDTTALAVKIKQFPTHIAGLPVAVNMGCHVTRHQSATICETEN